MVEVWNPSIDKIELMSAMTKQQTRLKRAEFSYINSNENIVCTAANETNVTILKNAMSASFCLLNCEDASNCQSEIQDK